MKRVASALILLSTLFVSLTLNAQEIWDIAGWRTDRNAAIAGQYNDNINGIGVNFPRDRDIARFVVCSSSPALTNDPYVNVQGLVRTSQFDSTFSGKLSRINGNSYCWRGQLDRETLSNIKRGHVLVLQLDKAVIMRVDLAGSAEALDWAWEHRMDMVERKAYQSSPWVMRGLLDM